VRAQLRALRRGDAFEASLFNMWRPGALGRRGFGLGIHWELLERLLGGRPYSLLAGHASAELRRAAMPSQRELLQEVDVSAGVSGERASFLWRVVQQANGCFMTVAILPLPPAHTEEEI
jgi:hypothetical protein